MRLIDADALIEVQMYDEEHEEWSAVTMTVEECLARFADVPTIIEMDRLEDEPLKTTDYCDICKRDMCKDCIADATNPYCVPSHYEVKQTEPQTEREGE